MTHFSRQPLSTPVDEIRWLHKRKNIKFVHSKNWYSAFGIPTHSRSLQLQRKEQIPWLRQRQIWSECWTLRKEDDRRLLEAEMTWLRRIRGWSRRERIRKEKTRGRGNGDGEDQKKKTRMVWARGEDGREETTKCSTTWTCERRQKQRKIKEEMDGQR